MIRFKRNNSYAVLYHRSDIENKDDIIWNAEDVMGTHKGKFLYLNDGSELFAKIRYVFKRRIYTSAGIQNPIDLIAMSTPRHPNYTAFSGCKNGEENFKISKPTDREQRCKRKILKGRGKEVKKITRRIAMLTLEELQHSTKKLNISEDFIVHKLLEWVNSNGQHAFKSLKSLCAINNIDIDKPMIESKDNKPKSLMDMLNEAEEAEIIEDKNTGNSNKAVKQIKQIIKKS